MMNLGHLPHLRCWSTCTDKSLRCALCSPQSQYRVSLLPFFTFAFVPIGSIVLSPYQSSLLPSCHPSYLVPPAHSAARLPRYHVPAPFGPLLPVPLPALYPFQAIAHTSSYDMSLHAFWSLCVDLAPCVPFPRSVGSGPSSAIISLMMISNLFHILVEFPRPRQELSLAVLWHHFPHHERLLRCVDYFELVLVPSYFQ